MRPHISTFIALAATFAGSSANAEPAASPRAVDQEVAVPGIGHPVGVGDLTGDGIEDLVYLVDEDSRPSLWLLSGGAVPRGLSNVPVRLANMTLADVTVHPNPLTIHDVDRDGRDDVVLAVGELTENAEIDRVSVLLGNPGPTAPRFTRSDGSIVIERRRAYSWWEGRGRSPRLDVAFADVNGDGDEDLIMAVNLPRQDPSGAALATPTATGPVASRPAPSRPRLVPGESDIAIMFGSGAWPSHVSFRPDVLVPNLGACAHALAETGDTTGDGVADILIRTCDSGGRVELPRIVPGRATWPGTITVSRPGEGARAAARSDGSPNVPVPPTEEPGRGYIPGGPDDMRLGELDPGNVLFVEDLDTDGVADVLLEFGGRIHRWRGGPDLQAHLESGRSDGVVMNAEFGATGITRGWRVGAFGDGGVPQVAFQITDAVRDTPIEFPATGVYPLAALRPPILDARDAAAPYQWRDGSRELWAVADWDGDRYADFFVGSAPVFACCNFGIVFGPVVRVPQSGECRVRGC